MNTFASAQKLAKAANDNIEAFQSFADIVLNASERLMALNIGAARNACTFVSAAATPVTEADVRDQFAARMSAQGQSVEQATEYFRDVNELLMQTQGEIATFSKRQFDELSRGMTEFAENFARSAPAGTSEFVDAVKTAMTQASAAYENFVKTSRDVAETNLAAASNALQPIIKASPAGTKSRKAA